jgi:glycosyltransferase involved in cell wall biosynthesis
MDSPLISVMMPSYNTAKYISRAIESLIASTYINWELIIVDDGSTDNTVDIASAYAAKHNNIKLITSGKVGCAAARNNAVQRSNGDLIARLDSDDWQSADRFAKAVDYFNYNPTCDIINHDMSVVAEDEHGAIISLDMVGMAMNPLLFMMGESSPSHVTTIAKKSVYDSVGGFNETLDAASDVDWSYRSIVNGYTWGYLPEILYFWRRHPEQLFQKSYSQHRVNQEVSRRKNSFIYRNEMLKLRETPEFRNKHTKCIPMPDDYI